MKYNDINKKLSDKVLEYMMNGYVINSKSMSGHQGEEGKVDLVKGEELIRIWINCESSRNWNDTNAWHGNKTVLRVGRWIYPASKCSDSWTTVWMKDLEVLSETVYYEIERGWYITDEQEAINTQDKRRARSRANFSSDSFDLLTNAEDIAVKYLKRVHGYQRVRRDNVRVVKNTMDGKTTYRVGYYEKSYPLH